MTTETTPSLPGRLFDLIQAPLRWQLLETALGLGVFDRLAVRRSAEDLAADLGLDAGRLATVLNGLAAMDLLTKQDGEFVVAAEAAPYLTATGDRSMVDLLRTLPRLRHGSVESLLRDGPPPPAALPSLADAAFWDGSAASLRSFHRSMGAEAMLTILEALPQWPTATHLLDVGAGSEVLATHIRRRRPDVRVTLCDLPPLAERSRRLVAEAGEADGITVIAGDYNEADLGGPHDIVWASMTLYYARDLTAVLGRLRAVLRPGGVVVSVHEGLTDEGTQPECHVVGRLVPELRGQSRSFRLGEIAAAMAAAGLVGLRQRQVTTPYGVMTVDIGAAPV